MSEETDTKPPTSEGGFTATGGSAFEPVREMRCSVLLCGQRAAWRKPIYYGGPANVSTTTEWERRCNRCFERSFHGWSNHGFVPTLNDKGEGTANEGLRKAD